MTTQGIWKPNWVRGGKVTEVAWIGNDVMAWCSGMHIVFYNVQKNQESLRWCSKSSTGEGASCISSYPTLNLFAYAEKVTKPRIFVYSYPTMTKITECSRGSRVGYLSTAFAGSDFLISVGTFPSFTLIVWSWRTGEKLKSISTSIHDAEGQTLRATLKKPILVAQMGPKLGKLSIWEVIVAGKIVNLRNHEVILPNKALVSDINWCPVNEKPLLAITDKDGHIYLSNRTGSNIERIVISQRCGVCLDIEPAAICWFSGGIVLRTTFCQIRFYKKDKDDVWRKQWYIKTTTNPCVLTSCPFKNDSLFIHTLQGHVMQLAFDEGQKTPVLETRVFYGGVIKHVEFVYPWGHHLVVVDNSITLGVVESYGGTEIERFDLDMLGDIRYVASHRYFPMVAVTSIQGEVVLISMLEPKKPRILGRYHLQKEKLDLIKFSQSGRFLVVCEMAYGVIYCIKLSYEKPFSVVGQIKVERPVLDLVAFDTKDTLRIFVLLRTSKEFPMGHELLIYEISRGEKQFSGIIGVIQFSDGFQNFEYVPGNPMLLIGAPCLTRQLHVLRLQELTEISIIDAMVSGHQFRQAFVYADHHWITTSGIDGIVIVRDKSIKSSKVVLMTHHRKDFGVLKAIVKASGDIVVALGHDGSLVSIRYYKTDTSSIEETQTDIQDIHYSYYSGNQKLIEKDYASLDQVILDMLSRPLQEFAPAEERNDMTWIEWMAKKKLLEEKKLCAEKRAAILSKFNKLKAKISKLLDENETCPEMEKLPISAFDLDKVSREQKIKAARDEREDTRLELEHECASMDRLSDWIKAKFWDTQVTLAKSIFSFSGSREIQNYHWDKFRHNYEEHHRWAVFVSDVNNKLMQGDSFQPWRFYTTSELDIELKKVGRIQMIDEKERMDALLDKQEEDTQGATDDELENQLDSEGKTSHRFIDPCKQISSQFACYSYSQFQLDNAFQEEDEEKLRQFWNTKFDEMYEMKEREMTLIKKRIEKIEFIDSELKQMFGQSVPEIPTYPEWHLKEIPEHILTVSDHEVKAKPYISPSEQDIMDQKAAEEERIRLDLLADDFRERALDSMMDGVLEVRWEDTIKKDIPKPKCMLKPPDQYKPEDVLAIMQYEKDVENLTQERERYRRILEADYVKVNDALKEGMEKFDSRLEESFELKMKVEAAIKQQHFRYARFCLRNLHRVEAIKKDDKIREKIEEKRRLAIEFNEQIRLVQSIIQDLQTYYDALCVREKALEKKFRSEFPALGKGALESLQNQYKRRPRTVLKNVVAGDLLDLRNSAVSLMKPVHLPAECLDYLKSLDVLDIRPASVPPSVSTIQWELFTRLRRNKIEIEMKIRAQDFEIKEANSTVSNYERKIYKVRSEIDALKQELNVRKQERIEYERNIEIQLVLKMGQVEIESNLTRHDTKDAVLIPTSEIEAVNEKILEAEAEKLKIMKKASKFRKVISQKEWEHKCLKMKIKHLKEELYDIQRIPVTRQIRLYLKRKALGLKDDKTPQNLDRQLEAMRRASEKVLRDYSWKIEDIENKIKVVMKKNELLDKTIIKMNVARCEMELKEDLDSETKDKEFHEKKMAMIVERSNSARELQENNLEVLELQSEHELSRLKRFPMLPSFQNLDDDHDKKKTC